MADGSVPIGQQGVGIPGTNGQPGTDIGNLPDPSSTAGQFGGLPSWLQTLAPFLGISAQALGAYIQQNQTNTARNYIGGVGAAGQTANQGGFSGAQGAYDPASASAQSVLSGQNPWMQQLSQGFLGNTQAINNMLPGFIPGAGAQNLPQYAGQPGNMVYQDQNMANAVRGTTDLTGNTQGMIDWASQMINSGGQTNTQGPLNQYSQSLMNGSNPQQQALSQAGSSAMQNGGMTPALQGALAQAMGVVQGGGQTGLTNQLAQRGLDLSSGNPLLSMQNAAGFAEDQSGRNFANAAQTARTQAMARGQGPGSIVASGAGNDALRDNSDAALAGTAQASQQALTGQQGLNLQQLAQGLNTSLSAADIQRSLELGGLGSVAGLTNSGTGLLGTGGSLTNQAAQLGNAGASQYAGLLGLQQSNLQQGLNTGTSAIGQQAGLLQSGLQNLMSGQQGSANLGNMLAQLYLQNQGQYQGAINSGLGAVNNANQTLNQQGGQLLGYAGQGLGTEGTTASAMSRLFGQPNSIASFTNNVGGALGSPLGTAVKTFLPPTVQLPSPSGSSGPDIGSLFTGAMAGPGGGDSSNPFGGFGGGPGLGGPTQGQTGWLDPNQRDVATALSGGPPRASQQWGTSG